MIKRFIQRTVKIVFSVPGIALIVLLISPLAVTFWQMQGLATASDVVAVTIAQPGRLASIQLLTPNSVDQPVPQSKPGQPYPMTLLVDTNGSLPQEIQASYRFDPQAISLALSATSASACGGVPDQAIDTIQGILRFRCVLSGDVGKSGTRLPLTSIIVTPKKSGSWQLSPIPGASKATRTNGLVSTDVLRSSTGFQQVATANGAAIRPSFTSSLLRPELETTKVQGTPPDFPVISSATTAQCNASNAISFRWPIPTGTIRFEYAWTDGVANPEPSNPTVSSELTLPTKRGQIQYFTIRAVGLNNTKGPVQQVAVKTCDS
jgi:hypothetical protein